MEFETAKEDNNFLGVELNQYKKLLECECTKASHEAKVDDIVKLLKTEDKNKNT